MLNYSHKDNICITGYLIHNFLLLTEYCMLVLGHAVLFTPLVCRLQLAHTTTLLPGGLRSRSSESSCHAGFFLQSSTSSASDTHCAVGPAKFNLVHHPKLVDVFCKLLPDSFQVGRQHNLHIPKDTMIKVNTYCF